MSGKCVRLEADCCLGDGHLTIFMMSDAQVQVGLTAPGV